MNFILFFLLQSILMPPRIALENPAAVLEVPKNLKKDYDKAWTRFVTAREDSKVVQDFEKLLKKKRDFDAVLTIQAYLDLYQARPFDAERRLDLVLSRQPANRLALYYLAELAWARGEYARAHDLYGRLMLVDRTRPDIEPKRQKAFLLATENLLRTAAAAEQEGRFAVAESFYRQALAIAPSEPALHGQIALLLAKQTKWEEALVHLQRQLEFGGPTDPSDDVRRRMAEALMNLGRTEEAREVLSRLRESGRRDEELEGKVSELEDLGRWGKEIEYFRQIETASEVSREQLSAMIVRYFPQVVEFRQTPQIVTDTQDSWASSEIQAVVGVGLIAPLPNHTFRPSDSITRTELATSIAQLTRLLGVSVSDGPSIPVSDLAPGHPIYGDVQLVLGYRLMGLDDAGRFNVNDRVTGEEAVRAMERLLGLVHGKVA